MNVIRDWFQRNFSDPQVVPLLVLLVLGTAVVALLGNILAPVFASIVIAYLLEGFVRSLERHGLNRLLAVILVFVGFLAFSVFALVALAPLLSRQVSEFFQDVPAMILSVQQALGRLPELYPSLLSEQEIREFIGLYRTEIMAIGQQMLSFSLNSAFNVVAYTFLVPFLVFFFLKDKDQILSFLRGFISTNHELTRVVWREVDRQIGNYLRGKLWEILIVWAVSATIFALLGLQVPVLIGLVVGLSTLIPYIGAIAATFPVLWVAYFQWGWAAGFFYVLIAYGVIQLLDGNLLAPLLLSGTVNLHPIAVIVAILVFGGLWGVLGLFFAIPLTTLIRAVLQAWPRLEPEQAAIAAVPEEPSATG